MFGLVVDFNITKLKKNYDKENYQDAFKDLEYELKYFEFNRVCDNFYISNNNNDLTDVYNIVKRLSNIEWFVKSVSIFKIFKINDYSDFGRIIKKIERK